MICIGLCLRGHHALVVGGGSAALRKARELLAEGAQLTVCARAFCQGFDRLPQTQTVLLQRAYTPALLKHQLFVYAATDSATVNQTILTQARAHGCIALCASPAEDDPLHSMASAHCRGITTAVYTHGAAPALAGSMAADAAKTLAQAYAPRLALLSHLRTLLRTKISCPAARRRILRQLARAHLSQLRQLHALCLSNASAAQVLHACDHLQT